MYILLQNIFLIFLLIVIKRSNKYYDYICKNGVYERAFVYTINKRFMKTYNQVNEDMGVVTVELYDPDILFCTFYLKKVNNNYLIDNVQYDK